MDYRYFVMCSGRFLIKKNTYDLVHVCLCNKHKNEFIFLRIHTLFKLNNNKKNENEKEKNVFEGTIAPLNNKNGKKDKRK